MPADYTENDIRMKVFEKTDNIVSRRIAGELFLVPISGDLANMQRIFTLTAVAEFIWEKLDGRMNLNEIRRDVLNRFEVTAEQAEDDIKEFVTELLKEGLAREAAVRQ
jgi:Coenzyme PQQ synthesis protein D (PqqD)